MCLHARTTAMTVSRLKTVAEMLLINTNLQAAMVSYFQQSGGPRNALFSGNCIPDL